MQSTDKKKPSISTIIDSIAYFLAGVFGIEYSASNANWVTISVSVILLLIGLSHLFSTFTFLNRFYRFVSQKLLKFLLSRPSLNEKVIRLKSSLVSLNIKRFAILIPIMLLFAITFTQVFASFLNDFTSKSSFVWISGTYSALLALSIFYTGILTTSIEQKLYLILTFLGVSFYILLKDDFTTEKIKFLSISFRDGTIKLTFLFILEILLSISAYYSYSKEKSRQLPFKGFKS